MTTIANKIGFKAASLNPASCVPIKSKKAKPAITLTAKPKVAQAKKLNKSA